MQCTAHLPNPLSNMSPVNHGWESVGEIFKPIWYKGMQVPNELSETMTTSDVDYETDDEIEHMN